MDLGSVSPKLQSKLKEVQVIASRATRQETQGDYEQAFCLYVESVQKYLHLIPNIQDGALNDQLQAISSKLLNRAERIKSSRPELSLRAPTLRLRRKMCLIQGLIQGLVVSFTKQAFLKWSSIKEVNPGLKVYDTDSLDPTDIVQDAVTDCSLIAAFSLHTACLYPKGPDGFPEESSDGIYRVKLFLNGVDREIYDQVPISTTGSSMCAKSRRGFYFWPEKAVVGGYNFVGSNSSVDLHALTGWTPETILLTSHDYRSERSRNHVSSGFSQGRCLVSVGTNAKNLEALENVGLVPFHDYAVIGIQEDAKGNRLVPLLFLNRSSGSSSPISRLMSNAWLVGKFLVGSVSTIFPLTTAQLCIQREIQAIVRQISVDNNVFCIERLIHASVSALGFQSNRWLINDLPINSPTQSQLALQLLPSKLKKTCQRSILSNKFTDILNFGLNSGVSPVNSPAGLRSDSTSATPIQLPNLLSIIISDTPVPATEDGKGCVDLCATVLLTTNRASRPQTEEVRDQLVELIELAYQYGNKFPINHVSWIRAIGEVCNNRIRWSEVVKFTYNKPAEQVTLPNGRGLRFLGKALSLVPSLAVSPPN
ncbi:hypothetical protein PCASD_11957 [Puccinia coronata f. sp. avenae]|uniref:Calpain catalytic domain-containing protein n=1 Tax=Puccinia coronata f. sp. avenae TaxID=200324 RepID=A0A2N5UWH1_9BASI|nr:hypothetical protein PCASD_11957 [Puccinia coronata f. sp. avenae]